MQLIRKIEIPTGHKFQSYVEYQSLYMNHADATLIPNTEIWQDGELKVKINSLGCKGDELRPGLPVIGCFGCSVTFGIGMKTNWPAQLNVEGCQILNAGVEGLSMERILPRYQALRFRTPFVGVVLYAGWHNIIWNETRESFWQNFFDGFDGDHVTAICTLGTCLTEECRTRGLGPLLKTASNLTVDDEYFNYWCDLQPTLEHIGHLLDNIRRYNEFVRAYCAKKGRLLIDLHTFLLPERYENIPNDFFDVCHPRPRATKKIAAYIQRWLADPVAQRLQVGAPTPSLLARLNPFSGRPLSTLSPRSKTDNRPDEDLRQQLYTFW